MFAHRIVTAVSRLETFAGAGRIVPEFEDESIREIIVGDYRVVYRRRDDVCEILTVWHGARPLEVGRDLRS